MQHATACGVQPCSADELPRLWGAAIVLLISLSIVTLLAWWVVSHVVSSLVT
ncbi:MAG TPA: hypothetical protein VFZ28_17135 [Burkholderiaceae bacterium]|nr:hypothetical protein [Burkholderiaceae bacterium]